jgi:ribonuclease Z
MGMLSRTQPLNIYAPSNFGPLLKFFLSYYGEGIAFEIRHIPLTMKEPSVIYSTKSIEVSAFPLNHGIETFGFLFREKEPQYNVKKWKISEYGLSLTEIAAVKSGEDVLRVAPDGSSIVLPLEELGYKPFSPRSYAYCSDTIYLPQLADILRGVTLLYHEATYMHERALRAEQTQHSTAVQAATLARDAGVVRLCIGHFSATVKDESALLSEAQSIFPQTILANEGLTISI